MDGTGVNGHGHDYGRDFEQGYGNDFGNDFEHDRPRADLAIHGTILTHGVETYGTVVVRDGRIASFERSRRERTGAYRRGRNHPAA